MSLDNFPADCQPNPIALVLTATVQTLKNVKDTVQIFLIEANAIIFHGNQTETMIRVAARRKLRRFRKRSTLDPHHRRFIFTMKLQCVAGQILQ